MTLKWITEITPEAYKDLKKLDPKAQRKILAFLTRLVDLYEGPREIGLALRGGRRDLWRYRVGDYRIICEILDHKVVVMVLEMGHRRDMYRSLH